TGGERRGGPRAAPRFRDSALVSLEPPRPPGLPGALARLVRLERRHVDARHERRVAHDRARALAAHGVAHADGDEPAVLPPGAARRGPRRHRRPPPAAPRDAGVDARGRPRARTLAPRGAPLAPPARGRAGRDASGRALRPSLGALSRRPRAHRGLRRAGERALGAAPALRAPGARALGDGLRAPP